MTEPLTFFYDFTSPYAYFAAQRVDDVLGVDPSWQPIAFGFLLAQVGRVPWSLQPGREAQMRECEQRAEELGLRLRWPEGWPAENYSLPVLRGALVALDAGRIRPYSLAAFRHGLGAGRDLRDADAVVAIAAEAGVDEQAIRNGLEDPVIKVRLKDATDAAFARGVTGIPTVAVGDQLFWGEDRLGEAAAALR